MAASPLIFEEEDKARHLAESTVTLLAQIKVAMDPERPRCS